MTRPAIRPAQPAAWLIGCVAVMLAACSPSSPPVVELSGSTMGTRYSVQLSPPPKPQGLASLQQAIDQRLRAINAVMSTYIDESDLMRFNRSGSTDWQAVPIELVALVRRAAAISAATDGYYDITVGPLTNLWGFGNSGDRETPPANSAIAATLARVGYEKVLSREQPPGLRKLHPGVEIDLSSIAKGWAVDHIGQLLQDNGQHNFLVDIGGETLTRGKKADGAPWRIAVERPGQGERTAQGSLVADNLAIATSGDYRNFIEYNNQRYSHTIDPNTGQTVRHRLASVTVVAENATDADAWATALLALGESRGPAVAEQRGLAALFVERDGTDLRELSTSALRALGVWQSHY